MKVNVVKKFINTAVATFRKAIKVDAETTRFLERNYVNVRRTSRHWGE